MANNSEISVAVEDGGRLLHAWRSLRSPGPWCRGGREVCMEWKDRMKYGNPGSGPPAFQTDDQWPLLVTSIL